MDAPVFQLVFGLLSIYLLLGLFVMALVEGWAYVTHARGMMLRRGIAHLLDEPETGRVTKAILVHPLVSVFRPGKWLPTHIPGHVFTLVLFDILANGLGSENDGREPVQTLTQLREAVQPPRPEIFSEKLLIQLRLLLDLAADYEEALMIVEHWYEDLVVEVTTWTKRRMLLVAAIVSLVVAVLLNADALLMAKQLMGAVEAGQLLGWSCLQNCAVADVSGVRPAGDVLFWVGKAVGLLVTTVVLATVAPIMLDLVFRRPNISM